MPRVHRRGGYHDRHDHLPDRRLTAHAGSDQSIHDTSTATLSGSVTGGIGPYAYAWTVLSGVASIASAAALETAVTLTGSGAFGFRLTVTDAQGSTAHDDITVTKTATTDRFAALSGTLGALSSSSAARVAVTAALAKTLGPLSLSSAGGVAINGSLAATLGALTVDSQANSSNIAALVIEALGPLTLSSAATIALKGTASKTLGALTSTATGTVALTGALSKTLGSLSLTAAGTVAGSDYWTQYDIANADRVGYVSSLSGNDANTGLSTAAPKATVSAGYALLRDGHADYLLFERGSTFSGGFPNWNKSGLDAAHPMVIGVYGTGLRPVFEIGLGTGVGATGAGGASKGDFIHFHSLDFYAERRDPTRVGYVAADSNTDNNGIQWLRKSADLLFEDCVMRWCGEGINVINTNYPTACALRLRACIVSDSYNNSATGHSQGAYLERLTSGSIDRCIFIHNGWHPTIAGAGKTGFNHGIYLNNKNDSVSVTNSIFLQMSSHGVQMRCGGDMRGNYCDENAHGLLFGGGSDHSWGLADGTVDGNVVVHGNDIVTGTANQTGITFQAVGTDALPIDAAVCSNNIVARSLNSSANWAIRTGIAGVTYSGNKTYEWPVGSGSSGGSFSPPGALRDLASYAGTLGFTATLAGAIAQLRLQRRDAWNDNLNTSAIVAYVQAGFP